MTDEKATQATVAPQAPGNLSPQTANTAPPPAMVERLRAIIGTMWLFGLTHWKWVLSSLLALVGYGLSRKNSQSAAQQAQARATIDADVAQVNAQLAKIAADKGAAAAHAVVAQTYADELQQLNDAQQSQAQKLLHNPAELAAFIIKSTGTSKKPGE